MAESEGPGAHGAAVPGERPAPAPQAPAMDVAAALGSLDRASREFSRRLGTSPVSQDRAPGQEPRPARPAPASAAGTSLDARMEAAEREAREYLEQAKRRADSLVTAMVGAVERQASEIRHEAEEGIRARWREVERDANRYIDDSRRLGDEIVTERRNEMAKLSDGITQRAQALTAGMEDADRVRRQFDAFVRALSITAGQIADDAAPAPAPTQGGELRDLRRLFRPSSVAA
jgi:F0F1-type ATP synthase membrane subunit b/b'